MECRITELQFDIAASAGWYSAIAGVLAGFALLAILLPLDHDSVREEQSGDSRAAQAVVVFTCAFFSLLILAFAYAVLAGRTGSSATDGIAVHEQLIYGSAFGMSTLLLLFALHALLSSFGPNRDVFAPAQNVILGGTSVAGPIVLLALQFGSALDIERFRALRAGDEAACGWGGFPVGVWINLGIAAAALAMILLLAAFRHRIPHRVTAPAVAAKAVLVLTVIAALWGSVVLQLLPESSLATGVFEHAAMALTATAAVGIATASWMGR
jgi:hypothetical protein